MRVHGIGVGFRMVKEEAEWQGRGGFKESTKWREEEGGNRERIFLSGKRRRGNMTE